MEPFYYTLEHRFLNLEDLGPKKSFVDTIGPRSKLVSPEVLLRHCHEDIQTVLEVWGIISYPSPSAHRGNGQEQVLDSPISVDDDSSRQLGHGKEGSSSSLNTQQQRRYDSVSIDLLALLESSTKVIQSVRQYSMHARVLTPEALTIHRQAALSVIEMLSILEQTNRLNEDDSDSGYPEGYCYARLNFGDLEEERAEMKNYLTVVQEQLFRPQVEKLETQLGQLLIDPTLQAHVANGNVPEGYTDKDPSLPKWLDDEEWTKEDGEGISLRKCFGACSETFRSNFFFLLREINCPLHWLLFLERCHAFLQFFKPLTRDSIPSPATDMTGFLDALR